MKKLSVIIPVYNKIDYVEECIISVLNQNCGDMDVIIVDDGSTDGSAEICDVIAKKDSRVKVIHKANQGLMEARYTGLLESDSEYVTFVDADDFVLKNAYQDAFCYMEEEIDMIVYEISRYYSEHEIKTERHRMPQGYYDRERIEKFIFDKLIWNLTDNTRGIECSLCNKIIKRKFLLDSYKQKKIRVYYGEDAAVMYPIFLEIKSMQVVPRSYYMHRQFSEDARPYFVDDIFFDECYKLYKYFESIFRNKDEKYNFRQQIEYFYIEAVKLKKIKYNDNRDICYFIFPFEYTVSAKNILLYGAGRVGKDYYYQLTSINYCKELAWVDKNAKYMKDNKISDLKDVDIHRYDYIVIAINDRNVCEDIKESFVKQGIKEEKVIYRVQGLL